MTTFIQWQEDDYGSDEHGKPCDVSRTVLARPSDVAKLQRHYLLATSRKPIADVLTMQEAELIQDFVTDNRAQILLR